MSARAGENARGCEGKGGGVEIQFVGIEMGREEEEEERDRKSLSLTPFLPSSLPIVAREEEEEEEEGRGGGASSSISEVSLHPPKERRRRRRKIRSSLPSSVSYSLLWGVQGHFGDG